MTIKIDSKDYDEDKVHQIKMKIDMKEHNFPLDSFIGGWYIDPKICDSLIQLFKDNKKLQKPGVIGGPYNVNKEQKNSMKKRDEKVKKVFSPIGIFNST